MSELNPLQKRIIQEATPPQSGAPATAANGVCRICRKPWGTSLRFGEDHLSCLANPAAALSASGDTVAAPSTPQKDNTQLADWTGDFRSARDAAPSTLTDEDIVFAEDMRNEIDPRPRCEKCNVVLALEGCPNSDCERWCESSAITYPPISESERIYNAKQLAASDFSESLEECNAESETPRDKCGWIMSSPVCVLSRGHAGEHSASETPPPQDSIEPSREWKDAMASLYEAILAKAKMPNAETRQAQYEAYRKVRSIVSRLTRENGQLGNEVLRQGQLLDEWSERESKVCPEDYSFEEYISAQKRWIGDLEREKDRLESELSELRKNTLTPEEAGCLLALLDWETPHSVNDRVDYYTLEAKLRSLAHSPF